MIDRKPCGIFSNLRETNDKANPTSVRFEETEYWINLGREGLRKALV